MEIDFILAELRNLAESFDGLANSLRDEILFAQAKGRADGVRDAIAMIEAMQGTDKSQEKLDDV